MKKTHLTILTLALAACAALPAQAQSHIGPAQDHATHQHDSAADAAPPAAHHLNLEVRGLPPEN